MKKDDLQDILLDLISNTLPYNDIKEIYGTIKKGKKYSVCLKEIEEKSRTDKKLDQEIKIRKDIKLAILDIDEVEDVRKKIDKLYKGNKVLNIQNNYIKWVAAASVAILIMFGYYEANKSNEPDPGKIYMSYYRPYPKKEINFTSERDVLKIAMDKYYSGNFGEAVILFNKLPRSIEIESERLFYLGLSYMEINEFNKAIAQFNKIITTYQKSAWANNSHWYLALSYLNINKIDKAKNEFIKITDNKYYNYKNARKILKKLR